MITPRDPAPINYANGQPLTAHQQMHIARIAEAAELLLAYMHDAEGTTLPGDHQEHTWSSRRMAIAATHIETAVMFARKAALE
jgi:hypothetical protein